MYTRTEGSMMRKHNESMGQDATAKHKETAAKHKETAAKQIISIHINGKPVTCGINPEDRLLDLLRNTLGLMGTKEGCGIGECGACTVLMNGSPVNSCMILAGTADGSEIVTIEGLGFRTTDKQKNHQKNGEKNRHIKGQADSNTERQTVTIAEFRGSKQLAENMEQISLHPLQEAFIEAGAVQCGFCTPGMIISSLALLMDVFGITDPLTADASAWSAAWYKKYGRADKNLSSVISDKSIKLALSGNLCRCTGYDQIIDAVRLAAEKMKGSMEKM